MYLFISKNMVTKPCANKNLLLGGCWARMSGGTVLAEVSRNYYGRNTWYISLNLTSSSIGDKSSIARGINSSRTASQSGRWRDLGE